MIRFFCYNDGYVGYTGVRIILANSGGQINERETQSLYINTADADG